MHVLKGKAHNGRTFKPGWAIFQHEKSLRYGIKIIHYSNDVLSAKLFLNNGLGLLAYIDTASYLQIGFWLLSSNSELRYLASSHFQSRGTCVGLPILNSAPSSNPDLTSNTNANSFCQCQIQTQLISLEFEFNDKAKSNVMFAKYSASGSGTGPGSGLDIIADSIQIQFAMLGTFIKAGLANFSVIFMLFVVSILTPLSSPYSISNV